MDIKGYIDALKRYPMEGIDGREVLDILFEYYDTQRRIDSEEIRVEYEKLYEQINHKSIREITQIELPLHELVGQYEMRGFKEGVKVGIRLLDELK